MRIYKCIYTIIYFYLLHVYMSESGGDYYNSFDDYLSSFKSKRRNQIKSERRKVIEEGVDIVVVRGMCIFFSSILSPL